MIGALLRDRRNAPSSFPRPIYRRRRYSSELIEQCVRWYLTYRLSYRDPTAMMAERAVTVSHTTIGLKSFRTAVVTFSGVELAHRTRKRQFALAYEHQAEHSP